MTLNSDLAANTVNIAPRAGQNGSSEIIINANSHLYALQSLNWTGGSVTGNGSFEVGGTDTINGTDATDKPTLGAYMDVGTTFPGTNQYYDGNLSFAQNSQWLVVNTNANISVNSNSTLAFNNQAPQGQNSVTAISNGDTLPHSIIVNGGTVTRSNVCELFVAMGLNVESGDVFVTNPAGQTSGNPLHFTGTNSDGSGLESTGGLLVVNADLQSDNAGLFMSGFVKVYQDVTLTLGVNAQSTASAEEGGTFIVMGTLVPHGGFTIYGGTFGTGGSLDSAVVLDTGNQFSLNGGELDVSDVADNSAEGILDIQGAFNATGGKIVVNVDSTNGTNDYGQLKLDGTPTLTKGTVFSVRDLNPNPPNVNLGWNLIVTAVSGDNPNPGDMTYDLPPGWGELWTRLSGVWKLFVYNNA